MKFLCKLFVLAVILMTPLGASAADDLDLTKAVKIGSGKTMVIEFTDPDCPFCRKAADYLRDKKDISLYIFFNPLPIHPQAKAKVQYILSAPDRAKAYEEVMHGKFDPKKLEKNITPAGIHLQEEHLAICKANKIDSTPTFMIYGRIIEGFDPKKLDALLK